MLPVQKIRYVELWCKKINSNGLSIRPIYLLKTHFKELSTGRIVQIPIVGKLEISHLEELAIMMQSATQMYVEMENVLVTMLVLFVEVTKNAQLVFTVKQVLVLRSPQKAEDAVKTENVKYSISALLMASAEEHT